MRLITVKEVTQAAEQFIAQHEHDFAAGIRVQVLDTIVPGIAMLFLMEKIPTGLLATLIYSTGVSLLRLAKRLDAEKDEKK